MTKPVICRILESRPLDESRIVPQEDLSDPYPAGRPGYVRRIQRHPSRFVPRRYPRRVRMNQTAPKGIWIDFFA